MFIYTRKQRAKLLKTSKTSLNSSSLFGSNSLSDIPEAIHQDTQTNPVAKDVFSKKCNIDQELSHLTPCRIKKNTVPFSEIVNWQNDFNKNCYRTNVRIRHIQLVSKVGINRTILNMSDCLTLSTFNRIPPHLGISTRKQSCTKIPFEDIIQTLKGIGTICLDILSCKTMKVVKIIPLKCKLSIRQQTRTKKKNYLLVTCMT